MAIGVASISTRGSDPIGRLTLPNKLEYCNRHNYTLFTSHNDLSGKYWHHGVHFIKVLWLLETMQDNPDMEWFFWIDADAIIMNMKKKLEDFLPLRFEGGTDADFLVGEDGNGINIGTFFLRNCEWSHYMLRAVWTLGSTPGKWETENDQGRMYTHCKRKENRGHISIVSNKFFNSYIMQHQFPNNGIITHQYTHGDFCIHMPGPCDKVGIGTEYLKKVIR